MLFKLSTAKYFYTNDEEIKILEKVGFRFAKNKEKESYIIYFPEINLDSLQALVTFGKTQGYSIILGFYEETVTIEIYNDFRE